MNEDHRWSDRLQFHWIVAPQRYLLQQDADAMIKQAEASDVLR